jgi:hypothetical protein
MRRIYRVALFGLLALTTGAFAERRPEERSEATHVVVGTVEGVYVQEDKEFRKYVVEVAVEKVEKGDGLKAGDTVYVRCYLWNRDYYKGRKLSEKEEKEIALRWSSYDGVPVAGQRVRAWTRRHAGKQAGLYPAWYEVVKDR